MTTMNTAQLDDADDDEAAGEGAHEVPSGAPVPAEVREAARVAAVDHSIRTDAKLLANLAHFGIHLEALDAMLSQASTASASATEGDGGGGGGGGGGNAAAAAERKSDR